MTLIEKLEKLRDEYREKAKACINSGKGLDAVDYIGIAHGIQTAILVIMNHKEEE